MSNNDSLMNEAIPLAFHLSQNYPNPFKEKTRIKYCVAYKTRVQLTVLNSAGDVIAKLVDEEKNSGTYEIEFAACVNSSGDSLSSGVYFYNLQAGDYVASKKMLVLK